MPKVFRYSSQARMVCSSFCLASRRGGVLYCHQEGMDITLSGKVAKYSEAEIL
ncbi:MAG: hypothetical protein IKE08_04745 [Clostridia bacterium]|nr:hypothetical protein [Clostridia bacterium]